MRHVLIVVDSAAAVGACCHLLFKTVFINQILKAYVVIDLVLKMVLFLEICAKIHALRDQIAAAQFRIRLGCPRFGLLVRRVSNLIHAEVVCSIRSPSEHTYFVLIVLDVAWDILGLNGLDCAVLVFAQGFISNGSVGQRSPFLHQAVVEIIDVALDV